MEYAYVGVAECGCIRAAAVDNPAHAKEVRKDVSGFMRDGMVVERRTVAEARVQLCLTGHGKKGLDCPHAGACPERSKKAATA